MKTKRFFIAALLGVAATSVAVVSCKKETQNVLSSNNPQSVKTFTAPQIDDMNAYLKGFKQKMQSTAKGDEALEMEDARWHLESVMNYSFGDAGHNTSDIQCDTFYYSLHAFGSKVTLSQLNEAYNNFAEDVSIAFVNCPLPEKSILAIHVAFENRNIDGDFTIRCILCSRGYIASTWPPRFDSTDYWDEHYYWEGDIGFGKCGPYSGQCIGSGAPKELTEKANLRILPISCGEGFRTYVLNPVSSEIIPEEGPFSCFMYDENSPSGYKLYVQHTDDGCIPPDEMNYYLDKSQEIIELLKSTN